MSRRNFVKDLVMTGVTVVASSRVYPYIHVPNTHVPTEGGPTEPGTSDWPRFGYDLHNTRFNSREDKLGRDNVGRLQLKWKFETDAPIQTTPTVVGDTLYFGTLSGYQHALDTATGIERWQSFMGYNSDPAAPLQGVRSSAQHENGRLYFGTGLAKVHCLDANSGEELWQTQLDEDPITNRAQIFCSVAVYRGKVYVGTSSPRAKAVCLDAKTGRVRWQFYVVPDRTRGGGGSIWTSPAIDEISNVVYFATGSVRAFIPPDPMLFTESVIAFEADTGEMLWYDQVRAADPFDLDYSCHPMIFDAVHPSRGKEIRKSVGAGNKSGFYCFNRYNGERLWKAQLTSAGDDGGPILNSTATAYNRVFVVSNALGVRGRPGRSVAVSLHAYTGDITWWVANSAPISGPVAVANQVFYQGLEDGTLEAIDTASGEQLWKHQLPGMIRGGMAIANGHLYTSTGDTVGWTVQAATRGKSYAVYAFEPA